MTIDKPRMGAEAVVTPGEWQGRPVVYKRRAAKGYRVPELDRRLCAERTRREARMLHAVRRAGLRTPFILHADTSVGLLVLELLEGPTGKEVLDTADEDGRRALLRALGEALGTMHRAKLAHGDLTTSNMIWMADGADGRKGERGVAEDAGARESRTLGILDLSLGQTEAGIEELGVDLRLFEEQMGSAHPESMHLLDSFYEGYAAANPDAEAVRKKCEDIRARGRYR